MSKQPDFDMAEAHRYFSVQCFNKAWDYIDMAERTEEENEQMLQACMASLWHWSERDDVQPSNYSVGYWQASRVLALMGKGEEARRYGRLSLDASHDLEPFYIGYAYEALARGEMVIGNVEKVHEYLDLARQQCEKVSDKDSRKLLEADLKTIG